MKKGVYRMNKIAITTGYMGSGSSAVTDLISEFKGYDINNGDFEYVMLHCPDGLFDLEDKLLNGNNALRSDEAIYRFEKCMSTLYDKKNYWPGMYKKRVSIQYEKITNDFIARLTDFKYDKTIYWYFQQIPDSFILQCRNYLKRLLKHVPLYNNSNTAVLKYTGMRIAYPTSEKFYKNAKQYLHDFYCLLGYENHNLLLDQFVLPHNLFRINNYFNDNTRIIITDRDPRDVFVLNKYVWLKKGCPVAYPISVNEFCSYYRKMRNSEKKVDDNRILRIHFEDLIYDYDYTLERICIFLDLKKDDHINIKKRFNPQISINNTQVFRKYLECNNEASIIKNELKEFIYDFPYDIPRNVRESF